MSHSPQGQPITELVKCHTQRLQGLCLSPSQSTSVCARPCVHMQEHGGHMSNKAIVWTKNPSARPRLTLTYYVHVCECVSVRVCRVSTGVHMWGVDNYLPDKGHQPCFTTPILQFVVKVQLCVWICLRLCEGKELQKEIIWQMPVWHNTSSSLWQEIFC